MKEKLSSLAASEDWIHAKPLVGVGGGGGGGGVGLHPFCFVVRLFDPPSAKVFFLSWSSPIDFSPAESHVP